MSQTPSNGYVLVLRPSKKGINPAHLKKYQEKMSRIAPICAKKTAHLKGQKRVVAFNLCIAKIMREEKDGKGKNNNTDRTKL